MLPIVHHPDYDAGFAANHRFPMGKYSALMRLIRVSGLDCRLVCAAPAPAAWLKRAHDPAYVAQVMSCTVPPHIEREIGFAVGERVARRALMAAGGTVLAARLALETGIACNAAGGSHHARRAQGAGFCTFNDVAIAALALLDERRVGRCLVLDLDVHQGDGTADILAGNPAAFTVSIHGEHNYPARKIASDLDVALPDGTGDGVYLETLEQTLAALARHGPWDIVFYNAGVDVHADDKLGRLALSEDGLRRRERMVIAHFQALGVPLCGVIGGGYAAAVEALAARHLILFETAADFSGERSAA